MTRNERICAAYASGVYLAEIGREHGITKQRVRQIVAPFPALARAHRAAKKERQERSRYRRCLACGKGFTARKKPQAYCSQRCYHAGASQEALKPAPAHEEAKSA